ncbi:hypothetical protein [Nannocystis sp.]|uniref:hypothetical protein n=1 Tax=Nannocystis sp. TaxID=1962667 RepID=UPI0025EEC9AF|nr:hypothetical protein [Nannocystis sp.]MBK7828352.1 hypothetical protein [Nannocystis sp.]
MRHHPRRPAIGRRELCLGLPALAAAWTSGCLNGRGGPDRGAPSIPERVHVALDAPLGPYDRLSGVQGSPYPEVDEDVPHIEAFRAHHIERTRFPQDCPANTLTLAGIFPDERADPDDPASYNFAAIDRHVRAAREVGLRVLWQSSYDIGGSDRWVGLNLGGRPIRDLDRWSRVLARCLEHFSIGWAGGFERGIDDVEFLNEGNGLGGYGADGAALHAAFRRFLATVSAHNRRHPDAQVRPVGPGIPLSIVEWPALRGALDRMLADLVRSGTALPVLSFHSYGADTSPAANARLAREHRALLDAHGLTATELWNSEWQAGDFLRTHLDVDPARARSATPDERRVFAQGVASYALSCKARWQGVVTGSFYYRAGRRAWPPGQSAPLGNGDGSAGFFSPAGRVGALALQELLTHRLAQRTPQRCAVDCADDPLFTALGLRGEATAAALLASLTLAPRRIQVRLTGGPALTRARVVRIDTDAQALAEEDVPITRADDGAVTAELTLGALAAAVLEVQ